MCLNTLKEVTINAPVNVFQKKVKMVFKKGYKQTEEHKIRRSNSLKEKYKRGYLSPRKNVPPWNKGLKTSQNTIEKIRNSMKGKNLGEKNGVWKGENVQYHQMHKYIRNHNKSPLLCEDCNKKRKLDIANFTGRYNREIKNYKWLCRSCHSKLDDKILNLRGKNGKTN